MSNAFISKPPTKAESDAAQEAWKQRQSQAATFLPVTGQPTAWKSAPGAVRFAVWLWAIFTIIGFTVSAIMLVVMLAGGGFALSQM